MTSTLFFMATKLIFPLTLLKVFKNSPAIRWRNFWWGNFSNRSKFCSRISCCTWYSCPSPLPLFGYPFTNSQVFGRNFKIAECKEQFHGNYHTGENLPFQQCEEPWISNSVSLWHHTWACIWMSVTHLNGSTQLLLFCRSCENWLLHRLRLKEFGKKTATV